MEIAYRPKH